MRTALSIHDLVRVEGIADAGTFATKEANQLFKFVGKVGRIVDVIRGSGGVGDSATDPFYIVEVGKIRDGFWGEELKKLG